MSRLRSHLVESGAAFRAVFRNANLRRMQLGLAGSVVGHWAYVVVVSVFAYDVAGVSAVGVLWLVRMLPAAILSPVAAMLADRYRRERVMLGSDLVRAGLIVGAAAVVWLGAPDVIVFALASLVAVAATPVEPASRGLLPSLVSTPGELTAGNVVAGSIASFGFFLGPALGGVLLIVVDVPTAFVATAVPVLGSAFFVARIHGPERQRDAVRRENFAGEALAGFRTIVGDRRLRLLVGLLTATTIVDGALEVLIVVSAIELLDLGNPGVGYLNTAFGVGALVGSIAAIGLVGVRRLSLPFLGGVVLWGLPVVLMAAFVEPAVALAGLALVGVGNMFVDVAGSTLVQRAVPDEVLSRVFGMMQSLWLAALALGAMLAPVLVNRLGPREALLVTGCFLPALVIVFGSRLVRVDAAATAPARDRLALLRAIPMFGLLPGPTLERLVSRLIPVEFEAGTELMRQGDPGDRFYVIAEGAAEVTIDGRLVSTLQTGDFAGEIALLRSVPRTATVVAKGPVLALALERDDFLGAVAGNTPSARAADAVIGARLAV